MADATILNFHIVLCLTTCDPCIDHIYLRTKCGSYRSRNGRDTSFDVFSQMSKSAILDPYVLLNSPPNLVQVGRDTPIWVFWKLAAAAILNFIFLHFAPSTKSPLLASMFSDNSIMISSNLSEVLPFYHFEKLLIPADFCGFLLFGDFNQLKLWRHHFKSQRYAVSAEPRPRVLAYRA